jgi:60 kDa SS-A/Ro ribonucleoprotein
MLGGTRMNLNTFARHGVFETDGLASLMAARLRDAREIQRARVFPYQLLTAYQNCDEAVPQEVRDALQDAMELAIANVPSIEGRVVVCPDVSGSMKSPVTGHRAGSTTSVRCVDVAALVAASVLRKNQSATVLPFEQTVVPVDLNSRDSVMTNAGRLASIGGGGTNCSAPVRLLNQQKAKADLASSFRITNRGLIRDAAGELRCWPSGRNSGNGIRRLAWFAWTSSRIRRRRRLNARTS